jgi:hypothetical protein
LRTSQIKVTKELIIGDVITEVKAKWSQIMKDFDGIGAEYGKETQPKAIELIR